MIIIRHSHQVGGLFPEAVVTLSAAFNVPLYNAAHRYRIRRPLGAYNISLQSILDNFALVLRELETLTTRLPIHDAAQYQGASVVEECQKNLLRSIDEHFDDCEKILKSFFAPGAVFNGNPHVEAYFAAIKPFRDYARKIINHCKHSQGRVRIAFLLTEEQWIIPTYYIEGVDGAGNPGPDLDIHPEGAPAFSFSRELRYLFCMVYAVSRHLSRAIMAIVGLQNLTLPTAVNAIDTEITEIARRLATFPRLFLRHEKSLDIPSVGIGQAASVTSLSIILGPGHLPEINVGSRCFVLYGWRSDGDSISFRLPFPPNVGESSAVS
jgi:hypothetical protein